ncbi:exodeoxyribonuclease VII large subunit [Ferruginibacter sp. HRS2-29]|uniref:exodeoxyribonuclease VII large subunit n=1 Tax=Ferruginibacter sp. HRS2-29 TaxID=2487334 RepID=UPI0020CBBE94|nr:exodeoxyribonuclease VII large subunit [Ferruginibacter sp. HRS2-29]
MAPINYIRLSELTGTIARVITANFATKTYWVISEISNLKFYPQKNYYFFDLVEKDPFTHAVLTSVKANAWSTAVARIRNFEKLTGQQFDNNINVLLQVSVEYHITYGLKLNIHDVDPAFTIGNLEKQKQLVLQQLVELNPGHVSVNGTGYDTYNKSLSLNPVLQNIALIGSPDSDGYRDFKHELGNNHYGYAFTLDEYPAQVQGAGMETGIVRRLVEIFISNKPYDAVVIVRGGGSQTDFLIFDSYEVGKAIARFPIPVFTGIGHTRNESIADMMAHSATKTPTKAAESIIAHNRAFEEQLLELQKQVVTAANSLVATSQLFLSHAKAAVHAASVEIIQQQDTMLGSVSAVIREYSLRTVYDQQQNITNQVAVIKNAAARQFSEAGHRIEHYAQLVKHLSPSSVLKRGYALLYKDGQLVTKSDDIKSGDTVTTVLADATIGSIVTSIHNNHE